MCCERFLRSNLRANHRNYQPRKRLLRRTRPVQRIALGARYAVSQP